MGSSGAPPGHRQMRFDHESGRDTTDLARRAARVVALTARGDVDSLDGVLESWAAAAGAAPPAALALWSGMRALL